MSLEVYLYDSFGETRACFAGMTWSRNPRDSVRCHSCCTSIFYKTVSLPVTVNKNPTIIYLNRNSLYGWMRRYSGISPRDLKEFSEQQWVNAILAVVEKDGITLVEKYARDIDMLQL